MCANNAYIFTILGRGFPYIYTAKNACVVLTQIFE